MKMVDFLKKEDGQILADKVKQSDFEIVAVEKRMVMNLSQNYLILLVYKYIAIRSLDFHKTAKHYLKRRTKNAQRHF
jgi:hypothetical protein